MSSNSSIALSKPLPTAMFGGQNQVQNEPSNIVPKDSHADMDLQDKQGHIITTAKVTCSINRDLGG